MTLSRPFLLSSGAEGNPAPGGGDDQVIRHLLAHRLDEVIPAAMHRYDHVRLEFLDLGNDCVDIILRRRTQVKSADDGVHLKDARNFLRLPHRIYDADMAAGADND